MMAAPGSPKLMMALSSPLTTNQVRQRRKPLRTKKSPQRTRRHPSPGIFSRLNRMCSSRTAPLKPVRRKKPSLNLAIRFRINRAQIRFEPPRTPTMAPAQSPALLKPMTMALAEFNKAILPWKILAPLPVRSSFPSDLRNMMMAAPGSPKLMMALSSPLTTNQVRQRRKPLRTKKSPQRTRRHPSPGIFSRLNRMCSSRTAPLKPVRRKKPSLNLAIRFRINRAQIRFEPPRTPTMAPAQSPALLKPMTMALAEFPFLSTVLNPVILVPGQMPGGQRIAKSRIPMPALTTLPVSRWMRRRGKAGLFT